MKLIYAIMKDFFSNLGYIDHIDHDKRGSQDPKEQNWEASRVNPHMFVLPNYIDRYVDTWWEY